MILAWMLDGAGSLIPLHSQNGHYWNDRTMMVTRACKMAKLADDYDEGSKHTKVALRTAKESKS